MRVPTPYIEDTVSRFAWISSHKYVHRLDTEEFTTIREWDEVSIDNGSHCNAATSTESLDRTANNEHVNAACLGTDARSKEEKCAEGEHRRLAAEN
jgi:hypothetical protein